MLINLKRINRTQGAIMIALLAAFEFVTSAILVHEYGAPVWLTTLFVLVPLAIALWFKTGLPVSAATILQLLFLIIAALFYLLTSIHIIYASSVFGILYAAKLLYQLILIFITSRAG